MKPSQATSWLTDARFAPYLGAAGGDHERTVSLYVWNARISAAIFETLHHVEVLLRNMIDAQCPPLSASEVPRNTWLEDPTILTDASRKRVKETIARSAKRFGAARRRDDRSTYVPTQSPALSASA